LDITASLRSRDALEGQHGHTIKLLVEARLRVDRFSADVWKNGSTLVNKNNAEQVRPTWRLLNQAQVACRKLEEALCLSPLQRAKAGKVSRKTAKPAPADTWRRVTDDDE
jgi:hypothetical protein